MADDAKKIRVVVLYGGRSAEHEVSLRSAASVIKFLDKSRFDVIPVAIDKQGRWLLNDLSMLQLDTQAALSMPSAVNEVVLPAYTHSSKNGSDTFTNNLLSLQNNRDHQPFDVIFPVLHGPLGEDGTVQGFLELGDVPYVGPGVLCSAVAMDKDIAKRLIIAAGLPTVPYIAIKITEWQHNANHYRSFIAKQLGYPVFVKPANLGSSVGIHKVKTPEQLTAALQDAFQYDTKILVEKAINAREIELSVLENSEYGAKSLVSIPGEIIPTHEFYSYEAKYLDENGAHLTIPAKLTEQHVKEAQELACHAFDVLNGEGMARVDLFLDKDNNQMLFNEINTIPGFTSISMYPKLWEASGISYPALLSRLVDLAIARHKRKRQLKRDWQ